MRALAWLDRVAAVRIPWWVYNGGLVALGLGAFAAALFFRPGEDPRFVYWPGGAQLGDTCAFLAQTGMPCPQCGMTRSWVFAARGQLLAAFTYNPGGLGLFVWLQVGALIGAVRLVTRRPQVLSPPWQLTVGWALCWMVLLYLLPWALRAATGVAPLP